MRCAEALRDVPLDVLARRAADDAAAWADACAAWGALRDRKGGGLVGLPALVLSAHVSSIPPY